MTVRPPSDQDAPERSPSGTAPEEADLAPRLPGRKPRSVKRSRWTAAAVVVVVCVTVGLLINNLLGDAALFFYNADEAVERRAELGDQRFRIQGTPLEEATETFDGTGLVLAFQIGFEGTVVNVIHAGDPPELFQPGVPVVLEGSWSRASIGATGEAAVVADDGAWVFRSDRMLVKHDNEYRNRDDYDERISEANTANIES